MIKTIEIKNFRSIKYIHQKLNQFQVLIGANASGKTTFMDAIIFISDIVRNGIDEAIAKRTDNFIELTYLGNGENIEFGLEVELPDEIRKQIFNEAFTTIRYELKIGLSEQTKEHSIIEESAYLLKDNPMNEEPKQRMLFPVAEDGPDSILNRKYMHKYARRIFRKNPIGNDNFYDETQEKGGKGWLPSFAFGNKKTALANLPARSLKTSSTNTKFPASTWLKNFLIDDVQLFMLDSLKMRKPSPPGQTRKFKPDGSNLPWVISELKKEKSKFRNWINHIKTALPDIKDVEIIERSEDKHKYIRVTYENGAKIPSWLVSDGTLRLFALTLPAYISNLKGLLLIEEPENGIHPKAIDVICKSLSSVYESQVLVASHSPIILSLVKPSEILCFSKTSEGVTDIVSGTEHPILKKWKGENNLSDLFAGGILD